MNNLIEQIPNLFPLYFAAIWLAAAAFLGVLSGWYQLASRYPNIDEKPLLQLKFQSGSMGLGVSMSGILKLEACPSGLRVGIWRIFGPFSKDFFVPWQDIVITRKRGFLGQTAKLAFGGSGHLSLSNHVADKLALTVPGQWPEQGPITQETKSQAFHNVFKQWLYVTAFAALFFNLAPFILDPTRTYRFEAVTIIFPAIVFGIVFFVQYRMRVQK